MTTATDVTATIGAKYQVEYRRVSAAPVRLLRDSDLTKEAPQGIGGRGRAMARR